MNNGHDRNMSTVWLSQYIVIVHNKCI